MSTGAELLFLDSFDHYATDAHMQRKWTQVNPPGGFSVLFVTGRDGVGQAIKSYGSTIIKTFENEYASLSMGCALNSLTAFQGAPLSFENVRFASALSFRLNHVGDGRLEIGFDGHTQSLVPGFVAQLNTWYYYEMSVQLSIVAGNITAAWEVHVNEDVLASGVSTGGAAATAAFASAYPGGNSAAAGGFLADDCYVWTGEFLGDIRIAVLYPNAPGVSAVWAKVGAASNWQATNEHDPDDLTTYVDSATPGDVDDYNLDDILGPVGVIKGAQALWCAQKSDSGAASFNGNAIVGSTTDVSRTFYPSDTSWKYFHNGYRKSPDTAADFTVAEIDAMRLGQVRVT